MPPIVISVAFLLIAAAIAYFLYQRFGPAAA